MLKVMHGWLLAAALAVAAPAAPARAASAAEIDARVDLALQSLLTQSPAAEAIAGRALAVLVFPEVVKAGFGVGGQFGEGALRRGGVTVGYYNIASASFGLQAGAQSYSQALFFMTPEALAYLEESEGFEIGADINVAVADEGFGMDASSTTFQDEIVAFVFGQQGLMVGATIEGSKITRITPD